MKRVTVEDFENIRLEATGPIKMSSRVERWRKVVGSRLNSFLKISLVFFLTFASCPNVWHIFKGILALVSFSV